MSTETFSHFGHLQKVSKDLFEVWFYVFFHDFKHVYSSGEGVDNHLGTKFWCQQEHLVTSVICCKFQEHLFEGWFYICFSWFISTGAGVDSTQGTQFWCQQNCLVTLFICCKFPINVSEVWFYTIFSWFNTCLQPRGRDRQPPVDHMLMSTERPYPFTHLLQVSKKSLSSLILYKYFHDLINLYSPEAGGIQPPGDKVLMLTETSCHFGHLMLVSNHRRE